MSDEVKGKVQLVAVIIFILISFGISAALQSTRDPIGRDKAANRTLFAETEVINPAPYKIEFDATGTVEARAIVSVVPQVNGRVISVSDTFFEGGEFKSGEVLFKVEPRDFQLEYRRLKAEVARAETSFDLEKAESKLALSEWKILNGDKPAPSLVARKPQLAEAKANLKAAQAQLENAWLDLDRTKVAMPFDGRVLAADIEVGQYVVSGQKYGEVFDLNGLEVQSSLRDKQLEWLLNSEKPEVVVTGTYLGKERKYKASLKRAASAINSQTRSGTVSFGFDEKVKDLLPGVFVNVEIIGAELDDILLLPTSALQKDNLVWLVDDEGKLKSYRPEIVYADDKKVAVRSSKTDLKIVVNPLPGATEGMEVMVSDEENEQSEGKSE